MAKNGSGSGFKLFYTVFILAGFGLLAWFVRDLPVDRWREILLFLLLIIIADSVQISLPKGGASIYASSPIDLAGIVLFGPAVMAVVEAVATLITDAGLNGTSNQPMKPSIQKVPRLTGSNASTTLVRDRK